jgi:hypothetical protein
MPSQMTVQVAGEVLHIDNRSGISQRTGEPYSINTVRVLVERTGVAEVTLPREIGVPKQGDPVSYLADASVYNGGLQLRALAELN